MIGARLRARPARRGARGARATSRPRSSSPRPGSRPRIRSIALGAGAGIALWGDIELAWRVRDKVVRADGSPADWVLITGHERQDDDDPAHRDDARRGRAARGAVRQHRRAGARRRARPRGIRRARRRALEPPALVPRLQSRPGRRAVPARARVPQPRRRPPRVARHRSTPTAMRRRVVYRNTRVACVYNKADAATPRDGRGRRGGRGRARDRLRPRRARAERPRRRRRACSSTGRSSRTAARARSSSRPSPTSQRVGPRRTAHRAEHPRRLRARSRPSGVEPAAIRDALRGFRLDPHRIEVDRASSRHHLGRRLQGHQPARRGVVARAPTPARSGSSAATAQGRRHRRARRRRAAHGQGGRS